MLKWWKAFKSIFKKEKKNNCCEVKIKENICENCVWWRAEAENNMPNAEDASKLFAAYPGDYKYCDIQKQYTHRIHSCNHYLEERFEATDESIQTEEYEIKHELSIEESESNDIRGEKK